MSAYTYAVELSADKCSKRSTNLTFDRPVSSHVENFQLAGWYRIPAGFYDRRRLRGFRRLMGELSRSSVRQGSPP
jgi:hypothetical protein